MKRQNLVIVRAGESSLHPEWLEGPGAEARNWDIIVNYFGNDPDKYRGGDVVRIDSKGPKWPALYELIRSHAELIGGYARVWLPDDDLRCACGDVNRLFEIFESTKLELAQPSLRADSYVSHMVTVHNPRFYLRYTNFIEVMAPCFTRGSLEKLLPTFNESMSGWGLDYAWPQLLGQGSERVAIIDDVQVLHTRPVGAANYGALKAKGISAWDENDAAMRKYGITRRAIVISRAKVRASGEDISRGPRLLYLYAAGFLSAGPHFQTGFGGFLRGWVSAIKHQLRN
jgi:hypothetical protein